VLDSASRIRLARHWDSPAATPTPDPGPDICAARVIVTHAGQGQVADVAAAERPAIVLRQSRSLGEPHVIGGALCRHRLAVAKRSWPDPRGTDELLVLRWAFW
jgi:hypothetical protein